MRNAFAAALHEEALANPAICLIAADISPAGGGLEKLASECPGRFINVGVAEQAMVGIAAGMALKGMRPFCYTIATFALYRPFEMIRDDLCYQNLSVTIVGVGAGLAYSTLGATHHAQEDIAIATALPNMRVIAPCDPLETAEVVRWCARHADGPVYLRLGKAGEPALTRDAEPWEFGKLRLLDWSGKADTCILTYGPLARKANEVASRLRQSGREVSVASVHTLKPLDVRSIVQMLQGYGRVLVLEEHGPFGGLADRVKQIACDYVESPPLIESMSLRDEFSSGHGTHDDLLMEHSLTVDRACALLQ